jgi:hypothetical protein
MTNSGRESSERRTPMQAVQVELLCGDDGCEGTMCYTGQAITEWRTTYQHKCDGCRRLAWFDQRYPHVEHEPINA